MAHDDPSAFGPDDGTPLHALAALRKAAGPRFDGEKDRIWNAIERTQGCIVQADHAKSLPEEIRHLVRALASAAECFILTPHQIESTYAGVLESLDRNVRELAIAIPRMPPAPDELALRVTQTAANVERSLKNCEGSTASATRELTAAVKSTTAALQTAGSQLTRDALHLAGKRDWHDALFFFAGLVLGGALVLGFVKPWSTPRAAEQPPAVEILRGKPPSR